MKTVDGALKDAIRTSNALRARPRLIAEWNMNRYYDTTPDNTPPEDTNGYDVDLFPIDSIVKPFRPTKGVLKARTEESTVYDFSLTGNSRYYVADPDDPHKYWTSPVKTDPFGNFPKWWDGLTQCRPRVVYEKDILVNKIVIKMENYWATPSNWRVQVQSTQGANWTTVSSSPIIQNDGTVTLYWNGTNWSSTKPTVEGSRPLIPIRGIQLEINSLTAGRTRTGSATRYQRAQYNGSNVTTGQTTGGNSYFNLIELSARREEDLSDRLINVSDSFELSETSVVYPIGTITQNTGNITLSNLYVENGVGKTGYFNRNNTSSNYYGILESNVKFTLDYIYTVRGNDISVPQFEMYGGEWEGTLTEEVNISVSDASKFLQELYPTPFMFENLNIVEIYQRVLDSVGFVDWTFPKRSSVVPHVIPVFWVTGEQNVWEVLNELAEATQSAIYFDTFGKLQIKTRQLAFDEGKNAVWTLRGENSGTELADIISVEQGEDLGTNHVTISYQTTRWEDLNNDIAPLQKVWEPDDTVVLRSSDLQRNLSADMSEQFFYIPANHADTWLYDGIVQIEGELIKYKGKRYVWYLNGQPNWTVVKSDGEKTELDARTEPTYRIYNHFDGAIEIEMIDGERARGFWNSEVKAHKLGGVGDYSTRQIIRGGSFPQSGAYGLYINPGQGTAEFANTSGARDDFAVATIGRAMDAPIRNIGTKVRFVPNTGAGQTAGLVVCQQSNESGYYIELKATDAMTAQERTYRGELAIWSYVGNLGNQKHLLATIPMNVAQSVWYEIDVAFRQLGGGTHSIAVWVNGQLKSIAYASGGVNHTPTGKFGMVTWGSTRAQFEYLYGLNRVDPDMASDSSFYNLADGGYTGDQWQREWLWGTKTRKARKGKKSTKETAKWTSYFFDEFGPVVHEVREFNVKFDPNPVQTSRLYMSNDWGVICPVYRSNPFGAYFVLTNTSRDNEVVNGEDNLTFINRAVNQILTAIARVLKIGDTETIVSKNDDSIRARGKVETEIANKWIQSKSAAQDIGDWINNHWSKGIDTLEMEVFGNPLLEITDVVQVEDPRRHMVGTSHKYFITSIKTGYDNGVTTTLSLRRVQQN